jgi:hypothetical protein
MISISQGICLISVKYNTKVHRIWIGLFIINFKISKCAKEQILGGWDRRIKHLRKKQT